jgi:hypothetical protein
MDIIQKIKEELQVEKWQVEAAVKLIDEGNTIPFISRYRKEVTGSLNDEQLRNLDERLTYLRSLEDKKEQVLKSIEEQGKLTDELKEKILAAQTLVVVEDLYRPYRPKRKTRASIAKEKGLEPLAEYILRQEATEPVLNEAVKYVSEEKEVKTPEEALQGAQDIIAESRNFITDCPDTVIIKIIHIFCIVFQISFFLCPLRIQSFRILRHGRFRIYLIESTQVLCPGLPHEAAVCRQNIPGNPHISAVYLLHVIPVQFLKVFTGIADTGKVLIPVMRVEPCQHRAALPEQFLCPWSLISDPEHAVCLCFRTPFRGLRTYHILRVFRNFLRINFCI